MINSYKSILGSIHNFSKYEFLFKIEWKNLNAFDCLLNVAKQFDDSEITLLCYFGLKSFIQSESNLSKLSDINQVINIIVSLLSECARSIALNSSVERKPLKLDLTSDEIKEVLVVSYKQAVFRVTELIVFLTCLTDLNEKYKIDLYENVTLKSCLNVLLFNGNDIEKEFIIKFFWELCKNQRVSMIVRSDVNLYSYLIGVSRNEWIKNKVLLKYSNLILYLIENNFKKNYSMGRRSMKSYKSNIGLENLFDSVRI